MFSALSIFPKNVHEFCALSMFPKNLPEDGTLMPKHVAL
jgi:hypothetical protein